MLRQTTTFFKRIKTSKNCLLQQSELQTNANTVSKWMEINCTSTSHQQRTYGEYKNPSEIKSPYKSKSVDVPDVTITELLWKKIEKFPDYTALECGITGRKYSFIQLEKLSQKFAVSLLKNGFCPGQTVAVVSSNCPEYAIVVYGCMEAGLTVTLINNMYGVDEMCYQLNDSGAHCVVTSVEKLSNVQSALEKLGKTGKNLKIIVLDIGGNITNMPSGVGRLSELISDYVDTSELQDRRHSTISTDSVAILPYSSGTTGLIKGVQLSHKNLVWNTYQIGDMDLVVETTGDHQDVVPGILPFFHMYGFFGLLTQAVYFGNKVVTLSKFEPITFLNTLKDKKCTILKIAPPMVLFLGSEANQEHLQYVRGTMCAAAPIADSDFEKFMGKIPRENNAYFRQAYGLTECTTLMTCSSINTNLTSVGKPLSNTFIKVVDVKSGEVLGPNQDGEIWGKGPQVMLGYHNNPKATAATIDSEGWLHTGDVGHYDETGQFYIVDRIKELIKVKGFQVAPAELENLLKSYLGVKDAGVVGVPDQRAGERPIAYIVQSSANPVSINKIKEFISQQVAPYKKLSDVVIVDSIPKSPSGKILRRVIRETYLKSKK